MQLSILKARSDDSFGLEYVTVYNWGTYDSDPDTIRPDLLHSWITGENQAGKSTFLDIVVTLLTPHRKRFYNAASGAEKANERTEKSYIKGAYKQGEEGAPLFLRPDEGDYSVLLGCFKTRRSGRVVCLAQVLWLQDEKVNKFYIVSEKPLTMDNFKGFESMPAMKRHLKADQSIKLYDQFNDYAADFMKRFGLRSAKALELFGVAVSLRDLENLGTFIRNSMLDYSDVSPQVNTVIELHRNSSETYANILKAEKQISVLAPLAGHWESYQKFASEVEERKIQTSLLKPFLSFRYIGVFEYRRTQQESAKLGAELEQKIWIEKETQTKEKIKSINASLSKDKAALELEKIDLEISSLKGKSEMQKKRATDFNKDARTLSFPEVSDELSYNKIKNEVANLCTSLSTTITDTQKLYEEAKLNELKKIEEFDLIRSDHKSLGRKDSNIPDTNDKIRNQIAEALSLKSEDLPFVGELIQIKKNEVEWEGALERLLHSNALYILVDDQHYKMVTKYVKQTHLRGKVSFMRVDRRNIVAVKPEADDHLYAYGKIAIKKGPLETWIDRHLRKVANHKCCETAEDLVSIDRGITKEGLIKSDSERHVKDDRYPVSDRTKYILGWDTRLKKAALETKMQEVASEISKWALESKRHYSLLDSLRNQQTAVANLERVQSFEDISFQITDSQILSKRETRALLLEKNAQLNHLKKQLSEAEEDLESYSKRVGELQKTIYQADLLLNQINEKLTQYQSEYEMADVDEADVVFAQLDGILSNLKISLNSADFGDAFSAMSNKISTLKGTAETDRNTASRKAEACMGRFKDEWEDECYDLTPSIQYAKEFLEKHKTLVEEDLRKYKERFREMFTQKSLDAVTILDQTLRQKADQIRDSIELLNKPLHNTLYSPTTKIVLGCEDGQKNLSVSDFQARLRKCLARSTEEFDEARQIEAFHAMNELVEYLTSKEYEADRLRALDVRNWLEFYAEERNAETGKTVMFYWSSGGGSGGQKSKLTLTILASAMAYQFGLTEDSVGPDSFNFVMLDEAFAKMDQKNSELVLSIFKEVGFQLLVASPPMYGFLVEPHIDCLHFASINATKSKSRIYSATRMQAEKALGRKLIARNKENESAHELT